VNLLQASDVLVSERVGESSDEDLMFSAMRGDRAGVAALAERYHRPLFTYLCRLLDGDKAGAEDLLQDTFMRLLSPRTYTVGRRVKPWLYAIATNLVRDRNRALARRRADTDLVPAACVVDRSDPLDAVVQSEQERAVRHALLSLGEEQRAAILLRFYHGLSLAEIAEALDVPLGTVKSRLSIGTRRLRDLLEPSRQESRRLE
jgi:RNA polymerase sigma-70 factor (ECF subfamily)